MSIEDYDRKLFKIQENYLTQMKCDEIQAVSPTIAFYCDDENFTKEKAVKYGQDLSYPVEGLGCCTFGDKFIF